MSKKEKEITEVLSEKTHLSFEEFGIMIFLKSHYLQSQGFLESKSAKSLTGLNGKNKALKKVLSIYFSESNGLLSAKNESWRDEIRTMINNSAKASMSAKQRWVDDPKKYAEAEELFSRNSDEGKLKEVAEPIPQEYVDMAESLRAILCKKMNKTIPKGVLDKWSDSIRLLCTKDLGNRESSENCVKTAIRAINNNYNKEFFPIIESGGTLRKKFSNIENYLNKQNSPRTQSRAADTNQFIDQL